MLKDHSHWKENPCGLHNLEAVVTVEDMERETPHIYAVLDNYQANHQSVVVEVGGNISKRSISVFIDPGSTHGYVSPKVVENSSLGKDKHNKSWLVQLAT